jgi:hypothetical protein
MSLIACVATLSTLDDPLLAQQPLPDEPAHKVYVMSGCLERTSAPASVFKLADATSVGPAPPADRSNTAGADAGARSYDLLPVASVSEQGINRETLEGYIGSRVEVTVRPVETSSAQSTTSTSNTAKKVEQSPPPRYTVVKIGKASGSCQSGQR